MWKMKHFKSNDGNILNLVHGRAIDSQQVLCQDHNLRRTLRMHSSLVQRLSLDNVMEGHQGCVNALAWNADGSMLLSGSDDTQVNVWEYSNRKLLHSIDSGHSTNIFCVKFVPETCDDVMVSGAGDAEVRIHRLSRSIGTVSGRSNTSEQTAFRCHTRRVKKLAVEDGNPHVIWSASEDGTLRQHDLRESALCPPHGSADQECRSVLLDLRRGAKRSLSDPPRHCLALKTCALNAVRPHQLLVGGSDAFARLYDRRMLPPCTSSQLQTKPPPCVCYFCPAHLSDYSRSGLHLTHVTFSPDGQEVLLSYSGEHVYLMDVNNGRDDMVAYMASDVLKRIVLAPIVNGVNRPPAATASGAIGVRCKRHSSPWLQECRELLIEGKKALTEEKNYLYAIETISEVLDAGGPVVDSKLQHDCLCIRAAAFLKRLWKNDVHMAIRDCNTARALDHQSVQAHIIMAEALSQLQKHKEALDYAMRAHYLDPSNNELSEKVTALRTKLLAAEETKNNRNADSANKLERRTSRIRSLNDLMLRSELDQSDSSPDSSRAEREDSDLDDEMEMEMEIEMSVAGDDERDQEAGGRPGSSLNFRLRRRIDPNRDRSTMNQGSGSGGTTENAVSQMEAALDMRQRYVGHCNVGTDIKQASFLGEQGDFVASGSDDGRWFIWQKRTGRLLKMLKGDENVVNCVQCHPFDCAIATSGIDSTIKIWTPCAEVASVVAGGEMGPEAADLLRIIGENQQKMRRPREIGIPLEILQRFRVPEGGIRPLECTQS
eukprot:c24430_g1_i1 orf=253-2565(+)